MAVIERGKGFEGIQMEGRDFLKDCVLTSAAGVAFSTGPMAPGTAVVEEFDL
jgi:hypothetical protein